MRPTKLQPNRFATWKCDDKTVIRPINQICAYHLRYFGERVFLSKDKFCFDPRRSDSSECLCRMAGIWLSRLISWIMFCAVFTCTHVNWIGILVLVFGLYVRAIHSQHHIYSLSSHTIHTLIPLHIYVVGLSRCVFDMRSTCQFIECICWFTTRAILKIAYASRSMELRTRYYIQSGK